MSELLPCPFCGSDKLHDHFVGDEDGGYYEILCTTCSGGNDRFAGTHSENRELALAAWNTRPPSRPGREEIEEAQQHIKDGISELAKAGRETVPLAFHRAAHAMHYALASLTKGTEPGAVTDGRRGIYIASKVKHAGRWVALAKSEPIISTWIYEAGEGETLDHHDLWRRCIAEASSCKVLVAYREPGEMLKGGWVEIGAALHAGVPVYAVGLEEYTIAKYRGVTHFPNIEGAFEAARSFFAEPLCEDCPRPGYPTDKTRCTPCPRRALSRNSTDE